MSVAQAALRERLEVMQNMLTVTMHFSSMCYSFWGGMQCLHLPDPRSLEGNCKCGYSGFCDKSCYSKLPEKMDSCDVAGNSCPDVDGQEAKPLCMPPDKGVGFSCLEKYLRVDLLSLEAFPVASDLH